MACIFQRNKLWPLKATYSHKFMWTKGEKICGHFMDNATGCTGSFQMTAPKDSFSKLLQTHELWHARQKNLNKGNYCLCVISIFSLCKHSTFYKRDDGCMARRNSQYNKTLILFLQFLCYLYSLHGTSQMAIRTIFLRFYTIFRWYPQKCSTTY